jgi:hypothetical protein
MTTTGDQAIARFMRVLSAAALDLARELDTTEGRSLDAIDLGSLQRAITDLPGMRTDNGMSPREIARMLERGDEPNIRDALDRMEGRGIVERVPNTTFKRYRLAASYR